MPQLTDDGPQGDEEYDYEEEYYGEVGEAEETERPHPATWDDDDEHLLLKDQEEFSNQWEGHRGEQAVFPRERVNPILKHTAHMTGLIPEVEEGPGLEDTSLGISSLEIDRRKESPLIRMPRELHPR